MTYEELSIFGRLRKVLFYPTTVFHFYFFQVIL